MPAPFILDPYYNNFQPHSKMTPFKAKTVGYQSEREERWNPLTCGCSTMVMLMFVLLGPLVIFFIGYEFARDYVYQNYGKDLIVIINHCETVNSMKSTKPLLSYTYIIAGESYNSHHPLDTLQGQCSDYPVGTEFKAHYLNTTLPRIWVTDERISPSLLGKIVLTIIASPIFLPRTAIVFSFLAEVLSRPFKKRHYERLQHHGKLLDGELIGIRGYDEEKKYYVTIRYRFCAPDGRVLWGKQRQQREDLRGQELPPPGTPVQVYYADKHVYAML